MLIIVGLILLAILAIGSLAVALTSKRSPDPNDFPVKSAAWIAWVLFSAIFVIVFLANSIVSVSTKNVGIVTFAGRVDGHLDNGLHAVWPWQDVTEMDAAIQTDSYVGKNCLDVRIANQQTACVDISIRWRIVPGSADDLFQNYRDFNNVRDSLVTRELTSAINHQLSTYNPLNSIDLNTAANGVGNPALATIAERVTAQMKSEIGNDIEVLNTIIPIMSFDPSTQARINQLQQQIALTRIAEQSVQTNDAQSRANRALAASVGHSPNVLVAQCLTILGEMVKQGQAVPAGFSCWPGGGVAGVIANSGGTK